MPRANDKGGGQVGNLKNHDRFHAFPNFYPTPLFEPWDIAETLLDFNYSPDKITGNYGERPKFS